MKIIRVHNPGGLRATKIKRRKTVAKRRRRRRNATRSVSVKRTVANPRRRRRRSRRRRNPSTAIVARRANGRRSLSAARIANPRRRRRRHHGRRHNPSAMHIGSIFKDMVYGAGGAILTRAGASVAQGFVPASFAAPYMPAAVQAAVAVFGVRWGAKKFLGQKQADIMMLGGLISAGLALGDAYFPNLQGQITGIFRQPVVVAPNAATGLGDVYEVPLDSPVFRGFGDVEDVDLNIFGGY